MNQICISQQCSIALMLCSGTKVKSDYSALPFLKIHIQYVYMGRFQAPKGKKKKRKKSIYIDAGNQGHQKIK